MELTIDHVRKDFDRFPALNGVSLDIKSGELIALLGPSGSGKTTLLRLIAGLETASEGRVFFGGEDASRKSVQERQVGFVFQHYALFRHMTVLENVGFGLSVRPKANRPAKEEIERRARDLIELVQLKGMEHRYPTQLSGGQRQRVALARALAIEPKVLLLDEPFGALDAQVRKDLRRWLREIHDRTGHTTVFVTHDQEEALELADRVVVMRAGRIEQVGTPDMVHDGPGTPFVHRFIGESAEFPVTVRGGEILFDGRATGLMSRGADGEAVMFFRPQDVDTGETTGAAIQATITGTRRVGGRRRLELSLGSTQHRAEVELPASTALPEGRAYAFRPSRWTLFRGEEPEAGANSVIPVRRRDPQQAR